MLVTLDGVRWQDFFGENLARLYEIDIEARRNEIPGDVISQMKTAYVEQGPEPSNSAYGWVL